MAQEYWDKLKRQAADQKAKSIATKMDQRGYSASVKKAADQKKKAADQKAKSIAMKMDSSSNSSAMKKGLKKNVSNMAKPKPMKNGAVSDAAKKISSGNKPMSTVDRRRLAAIKRQEKNPKATGKNII